MRFYWILFLLSPFIVLGCSDKPSKPDNLISEEKYIDLMVELQLVRSYGETMQADSSTVDSLTSEVFRKYETSDSLFQISHDYYQQFPQEHQFQIENAIEKLKMDQVANEQEQSPRDSLRN